MNFDLDTDQAALKEAIERYLADQYDFGARQAVVHSGAPFSRDRWEQFATMGWLALPFSEEAGGLDASPVELMVLHEAFGRALVVEPYLESIVMAGGVLRRLDPAVHGARVQGLAQGVFQSAFAHYEASSSSCAEPLHFRAEQVSGGYRLSGQKPVVYNLSEADFVLVSAALADNSPALFLVEPDTAGFQFSCCDTIDGRRAGDLRAIDAVVPHEAMIASGKQAFKIIAEVEDEVFLASSAELVGGMARLVRDTARYLEERRQFGVALSEFQVLRHAMADMFMALELSRSIMIAAAIKLRDGSADRSRIAAAARIKTLKAAKFVGESAVQLHGGIGTTDELPIGHVLKRAIVLGQLFGGEPRAFRRFSNTSNAPENCREMMYG